MFQYKRTIIGKQLKLAMLSYNYSFLLYLCTLFTIYGYWTLTGDATNGSQISNCYLQVFSYLPPSAYIFSMLLFWFFRLKIVFSQSAYRMSKQFENVLLLSIFVTVFVEIILIIVIISLLSKTPSDEFCYSKRES